MRHRLLTLLLLPFATVASADETDPAQAVSALWRAMGNAPGASADGATLQRLFHDDAVISGGRYKDGAPTLRRSTRQEFLALFDRIGEKGFHECEVFRTLHSYDRFAVAYSVVESRTDSMAEAPDFVGVNSVQLYKMGSQWQVMSLYYHVEAPGVPIPLDGGTSGTCID